MPSDDLFDGDWYEPGEMDTLTLLGLAPAEFDGAIFEDISRVVEGPARASAVFGAMDAGLAYMPMHLRLMHLYEVYDNLLAASHGLTERDVQLGLHDTLPTLFQAVLAYGLRPDLTQEPHDPGETTAHGLV